MEILWLVIGVTIGVLIAWFFLDLRCRRHLAEQEEKLSAASRRASQTLEQELIAHEETKRRLSDRDTKEVVVIERLAGLNADLEACRRELENKETDIAAKTAQLTALRSWNDDLGGRLKAADEDRDRLESALAQARQEHDAAAEDSESRISRLESRLRETEEAMAALEAELVALRAESAEPAEAPAPDSESAQDSGAEEEAAQAFPADNLTKIKGVGKVLKKRLNDLGITSFQQIADLTQADMERVNKVLEFPGRIQREKWVQQARAFLDKQRRGR